MNPCFCGSMNPELQNHKSRFMEYRIPEFCCRGKMLRIHDPFVPKTTASMTFMQFLGCRMITYQDRPHKVYISLKLRAFYFCFKKENNKNGILANVVNLRVRDLGNPDPRGGIEIQLSQYLGYMPNAYFIFFLRPIVKKACLRILIFQLKVPIMYP